MIILLVFFICLAASTIGGVCGIGGGVIIKPLLDAAGIMGVSAVSFLSGLTVLTMSGISVCKHRKAGALEPARSIPLGLGAAIGGVAGKRLFAALAAAWADSLAGAAQAVMLCLMMLGMLIYAVNKNRIVPRNITNRLASAGIGLGLGICSSFLGIGGGPMNLAVLYCFFSMDTKKAAVNSLLIILLSQTASFIVTLATGSIPAFDWGVLAAMVSAGAAGGFLASKLHGMLSARQAETLFVCLVCAILLICCYNAVMLISSFTALSRLS